MNISNGVNNIAIKIIELYQSTLSPDHSRWGKLRFPNGYCQYYPSCSEYTMRSIRKNGLIKGFFQGLYRIFRCNPLSRGGIDLVK